jgi:hypothetical protein
MTRDVTTGERDNVAAMTSALVRFDLPGRAMNETARMGSVTT